MRECRTALCYLLYSHFQMGVRWFYCVVLFFFPSAALVQEQERDKGWFFNNFVKDRYYITRRANMLAVRCKAHNALHSSVQSCG